MIRHLIPHEQPNNGVYLYGRLIDSYIKDFKFDQDIIHAELGYGEYELFWAVYKMVRQNPSTKLVLTIHDAPTVIGKPFAKWLPGSSITTKVIRKFLDVIIGQRFIGSLVRRADAIIVLNSASADPLIGKYRLQKSKIIISSLPPLTPLPRQSKKRIEVAKLLYFGNISKRKGLDTLIQALGQDDITLRHLDIVGSSEGNAEYEEYIMRSIQVLPKSARVELRGYLDERKLGYLIVNSDIVILPYREEGVIHASGPLATSMHAGKAIICSDVAAFNDVVNGKTGLVFKQDNALELAQCIQRLTGDAKLRQQLGHNAAEWSNVSTSRATIIKTLRGVYSSL